MKEKCVNLKKAQGRVLFVINDPCHNPTGYTMNDSEWDLVIDMMNELSEIKNSIDIEYKLSIA